jgi:hypothetical protein
MDFSHLRLWITNYESGTWCCLIEDFKINQFGVDKIFLFYRLLIYLKTVYCHISSAPFDYKIYTCNEKGVGCDARLRSGKITAV